MSNTTGLGGLILKAHTLVICNIIKCHSTLAKKRKEEQYNRIPIAVKLKESERIDIILRSDITLPLLAIYSGINDRAVCYIQFIYAG